MNEPVLEINNVGKTFQVGDQQVEVLKGINTRVNKGDFFVIFGPSGSGKSTLLHTLLGLERPTKGEVLSLGKDFYKMSEDEAAEFRKTRIGMVYQQPYWIKSLTVLENVAFPLFLMGQLPSVALEKAKKMLEVVGMEGWSDYMATELSSGQQQKIQVARAMINDPVILVADEPTGNLDSQSGDELMALLQNLNEKEGRTVIMVTHDLEYLKFGTRIIRVVDGTIADEYSGKDKDRIVEEIVSKRGSQLVKDLEMKGKLNHRGIKYNGEEAKND